MVPNTPAGLQNNTPVKNILEHSKPGHETQETPPRNDIVNDCVADQRAIFMKTGRLINRRGQVTKILPIAGIHHLTKKNRRYFQRLPVHRSGLPKQQTAAYGAIQHLRLQTAYSTIQLN